MTRCQLPAAEPTKADSWFKAIAAMSENRVIGRDGRIPWHLPEDFRWFKRKTLGHVVVMGRKTFESLGRPLPNRTNLVLTRHPGRLRKQFPDVFGGARVGTAATRARAGRAQLELTGLARRDVRLVSSLSKIDPRAYDCEVFICGGAEVYSQTLSRCSDLFLTVVKGEIEGDACFPRFEDRFDLVEEILARPDFRILHYRNRLPASACHRC